MENTKTLPVARPRYTKGEEWLNGSTHAAGALFGFAVLLYGILHSVQTAKPLGIAASIVYGVCMILTYTVSAVYHGLGQHTAKKVLRIIDHCAIYLLIMGTYTGIFLTGIFPVAPLAAGIVLVLQWSLGALAIVLTAIDMKKYTVFSMLCYLVMGWCLIAIPHIVVQAIGLAGFMWLLFGGIAYTVGSVLYGIGRKKRHIHGVFHIFCLIGSVLQFVCFAGYCF